MELNGCIDKLKGIFHRQPLRSSLASLICSFFLGVCVCVVEPVRKKRTNLPPLYTTITRPSVNRGEIRPSLRPFTNSIYKEAYHKEKTWSYLFISVWWVNPYGIRILNGLGVLIA